MLPDSVRMTDLKLDCALDIMRRLPPQTIEKNLSALIDLNPELSEELLSSVDQPLKVAADNSGNKYLLCDYNRDGDSYRSPWTNIYSPPLEIGPDGEGGVLPSDKLRILEVAMNTAFDHYRQLYFDGGISSCYLWDTDSTTNTSFAGVILLKKMGYETKGGTGCWDSIHVIDVRERPNGLSAYYKLISTCILSLKTQLNDGMINLGGSLTRQFEQDLSLSSMDKFPHLTNIGRMVEDKENQIRNELYEIYFGKTKDIINSLRSSEALNDVENNGHTVSDMYDELNDKYPMTDDSDHQNVIT